MSNNKPHKMALALASLLVSAAAFAESTPSPTPSLYPDRDTVILDGKAVTLHDLGLTQTTLGQLVPTGDVATFLSNFTDDLRNFAGTTFYQIVMDLTRPSAGLYVLVNKLPDHCIFTPPSNLPPGVQTANVGCTQGKTTYLVPDYLRKMDDTQKALLFIHERLHAYAPTESFEVKTDIVKAANVLLTRYHPALTNPQPGFVYTDDELGILNRFSMRLSQLVNSTGASTKSIMAVQFVASGGYILAPQIDNQAQDLVITPGSFITSSGPLHLSGSNVNLDKMSAISASQYCDSDCTPTTLSLNDVTVLNSKITLFKEASSLGLLQTLQNASIIDSEVAFPNLTSISHLEINKSDFTSLGGSNGESCRIPLSDIHIAQSSIGAFLCASHVDLKNVSGDQNNSFVGSTIRAQDSNVTSSSFRGNRVSIVRSEIYGSVYEGDDISVSLSNSEEAHVSALNHFSQAATTLRSVTVSGPVDPTKPDSYQLADEVTLDHAELNGAESLSVTFFSNTTLNRAAIDETVNEIDEDWIKIAFGTANQSTTLDGQGKTYHLKSSVIHNQTDLDNPANQPKPGKNK